MPYWVPHKLSAVLPATEPVHIDHPSGCLKMSFQFSDLYLYTEYVSPHLFYPYPWEIQVNIISGSNLQKPAGLPMQVGILILLISELLFSKNPTSLLYGQFALWETWKGIISCFHEKCVVSNENLIVIQNLLFGVNYWSCTFPSAHKNPVLVFFTSVWANWMLLISP